jgi:hypothetical protein
MHVYVFENAERKEYQFNFFNMLSYFLLSHATEEKNFH